MDAPLAVSFYELSVFLHVAAAVVAFGPTFAFPVIQKTAQNLYPEALPFALRAIHRIEKGIVVPVALVVGITGVYQTVDGPYELGRDKWLDIGLTLYVLAFIFALVVFRGSVMERGAEAAERMHREGADGAAGEEYATAMRLPNVAGPILAVTTVVIIYMMVVKPFPG